MNTNSNDDWDYKENLFLAPCSSHNKCGNYILYVKGERTHFKNVPQDKFINTASLSVDNLFDLYRSISEILDVHLGETC